MELAFKIAGICIIINGILSLILLLIKLIGSQSLAVEILSLVFSSSLSTCAIFLLILGNELYMSSLQNFFMVVILIGSLIYLIKTIVNNYTFVEIEVYVDTTPNNDDTPNNTPDE